MVRRSAPQQHLAEDYFPVRVRVAVPPKGFGEQINTIHGWLNQHIGKDRHWVGADVDAERADAVLFYFIRRAGRRRLHRSLRVRRPCRSIPRQ